MNRIIFAGLACLACLLAVTPEVASGMRAPPAPVPMRLAAASAAYVGKVTAVSKKAAPWRMAEP